VAEIPYIDEAGPAERLICSWPFRIFLIGVALMVIYRGMVAMKTTINMSEINSEEMLALLVSAWSTGWEELGNWINDSLDIASRFWRAAMPLILKGTWTVFASYSFVRPIFSFEYIEDVLYYIMMALALVGVAFLIMYSMGFAVLRW